MKKIMFASVAAVLFTFFWQTDVTAGSITFDDFTTDVGHTNYIPEGGNGYAGIEWYVDKSSISRARWTILANEYLANRPAHSGNYVAHIAYGAQMFGLIFPEAVNFTGAWFSNAFGFADSVTAIGYRQGQEVGRSAEVALFNSTDWMHLGATLDNVDQVAFLVHQNMYANRADVLVDDITFTNVGQVIPEPASWLLFLLAAGCMAKSRQKEPSP
jgi:hypothetical protein